MAEDERIRDVESTMNPSAWLEKTVLGYQLLSDQEREAIKDFSLLWSLYEGTILNARGNADAIIRTINSLKERGKLVLGSCRPAIEYFIARYFDETDLTYAFHELHLRPNDHRPLVEKVIRRKASDDAEVLSAILIIVLRLRNNLFHGVKWSYGIKGQLDNFTNANTLLMSVMEMHQT
jgi:hypothetical protein